MRHSASRRLATPLVISISLIVLYSLWTGPTESISQFTGHYNVPSIPVIRKRCEKFRGAKDVLVVFKTGATEVADKLPIHVRTSLECFPNSIIFSDHSENFQGHDIQDVLGEVNPAIQHVAEEFQLYLRLQRGGRDALAPQELSGTSVAVRPDVPGFKLDKWKLLPMLSRAYKHSPNMKWYFVVEADTYVFWSQLLELLSHLDHRKAYYAGSPAENKDIRFAEGGSGIVISNSAMQSLVSEYDAHKVDIENLTLNQDVGDYVLGKVFNQAGINMTNAAPYLRNSNLGGFRWDFADFEVRDDPLWCYPVVSYHHMQTDLIQELWDFEQTWLSKWGKMKRLRNKEIFSQFLLPRMRLARDEWDNGSETEHKNVQDAAACEKKCEKIDKCLQYRFDATKEVCTTANEPLLGSPAKGTKLHSGWMHDRIEAWKDKRPQCSRTPWGIGPEKKEEKKEEKKAD